MAAFDGWAEYYDLIHDGLPGDTDFYVHQALRCGGDVLELGVGTGRVALPMAMAGLDVTGIDNSAAMLALCRAKQQALGVTRGRLSLLCADMTRFRLDRQFPLIVMPYRTFMHVLTPAAQRRCLSTIRDHMTDTGRFVFNVWAPTPPALARIQRAFRTGKLKLAGRYRLPETATAILHYHRAACDMARQQLIEEHVIREVDAQGRVCREVTLPMVRVWATPREMDLLLDASGFSMDAVYGDFNGGGFTEKSTERVYVLTKTARR